MSQVMAETPLELLGIIEPEGLTVSEYLENPLENTIYRLTDVFGVKAIYMLLPTESRERLLIIGPYLGEQYSKQETLERLERYNIDPAYHRLYHNFLMSLPVIREGSHFFVTLSTFAERTWGQGAYRTVEVDRAARPGDGFLIESNKEADAESILANMKLMEERYSYENELMRAVSEGQYGRAELFISGFQQANFEKRIADPLRNTKNYCIITNTLLRKAAERGGVHPVNIDKLSSSFAVSIEQCSTQQECISLIRDMFRRYCRLVNKHSGAGLSPIVQKTVAIIDADLSRELSLSMLAEAANVSPGYLSSIFKRDMGKTVTEYITEKRIRHAEHLLETTHLQIQTVALYSGIMDVQYFSKLFKKHSGLTPREYRDRNKR
ncbi:MAG: helix-turn-helix domain-containing protein [Clostridia bacterium]|nr:helix-turn-helix domain-containing protein [Clostridia bacterium]